MRLLTRVRGAVAPKGFANAFSDLPQQSLIGERWIETFSNENCIRECVGIGWCGAQ
jgi:hypothetical protein